MKLLNPPLIVVVIVDVPWPPCGIVSEDGEAEIVKSPVADSGKVNNKKPARQAHRIARRWGTTISMSLF